MTVHLRREQCCESDGCMKPARYGSLCAPCFMAATPARRAVELLACDGQPTEPIDTLEITAALPSRMPVSEQRHLDFDLFYARLEQARIHETIVAAVIAAAFDEDDETDQRLAA